MVRWYFQLALYSTSSLSSRPGHKKESKGKKKKKKEVVQ